MEPEQPFFDKARKQWQALQAALGAGGEGDVYVKEIYTWNWNGGNATSIEGDYHYTVHWSESGEYTVQVTSNLEVRRVGTDELLASAGPTSRTADVTVVKVGVLQYKIGAGDYQNVPGTLYVRKGTEVYFKAIRDPAGTNWPAGKPVWGGTSGASGTGETASVTFNTTSTNGTDYKTVTAECGNTVTANVLVVAMDKLRQKPKEHGSYQDSPVPPSFMAVGKNSTFTFQAISDPEDAETWPSGKPAWGGQASGTGTFKDVTFSSASSTPTDYKTVSAECGNTVTVNVQVVDITQFPIESKRDVTGALAESYYPVKANEHYETGNPFKFQLDLDSWAEPIDLRHEMWDTDGFNQQLVDGNGGDFTYTFQSGTEAEGDVLVRFYIDNNGNLDYDSGEPTNNADEFWVQQRKEYVFDVDYSSKLGTLTLSNVQDGFDNAAAVLLKKNSANDYRACVTFAVNSLTQFTADENRPDPADDADKRALHYDAASDIALVQKIEDDVVGYCRNNNLDEIILDWEDPDGVEARDIAHEIGHGVGLHHHEDIENVMYGSPIGLVGDQYGTQLTASQADTYD